LATKLDVEPGQNEFCPVILTVSAAGGKLANAFAVKICKMSAAARKIELAPFR
jgi:hypothetical protein